MRAQGASSSKSLSSIIGFGAAAVVLAFLVMELVRGVDRVESLALVLFAAIAVASRFGAKWAVGAAVAATVVYGLARRNALDLASTAAVNRMIVGRAVGFMVFGLLLSAITRAFVRVQPAAAASVISPDAQARAEAELLRARRYKRPLAVLPITDGRAIDQSTLAGLRGSDLVVQRPTGGITIVLPETDRNGASVVAQRMGVDSSAVLSLRDEPDLVSALIAV